MGSPAHMPDLQEDEGALGVHGIHYFFPTLALLLCVDSWSMQVPVSPKNNSLPRFTAQGLNSSVARILLAWKANEIVNKLRVDSDFWDMTKYWLSLIATLIVSSRDTWKTGRKNSASWSYKNSSNKSRTICEPIQAEPQHCVIHCLSMRLACSMKQELEWNFVPMTRRPYRSGFCDEQTSRRSSLRVVFHIFPTRIKFKSGSGHFVLNWKNFQCDQRTDVILVRTTSNPSSRNIAKQQVYILGQIKTCA